MRSVQGGHLLFAPGLSEASGYGVVLDPCTVPTIGLLLSSDAQFFFGSAKGLVVVSSSITWFLLSSSKWPK